MNYHKQLHIITSFSVPYRAQFQYVFPGQNICTKLQYFTFLSRFLCVAHSLIYSQMCNYILDKYEEDLWRASLKNKNIVENGDAADSGIEEIHVSDTNVTDIYVSKSESDLSEHVPVFKSQLPKTVQVEGRERFRLELFCDGHPLPEG